ncbi:MAG: substrate-binding domain-containing protein [Lachnospiraceae bacterium]|nr:substrate-binding domain-containing protein [Lachnospiraceae bacterium]
MFTYYPELFPQIDSSTARKPITAAIYEFFMGADSNERYPLCSKTHGAWINLADGTADLVFLVAPTEEEESYFREKKVNIEMKPYGYDGLGFIVSPECEVKCITSEQIRGIYEGRITNWKELGGPDADIHPYFRDDQSGSQRLFESFLWPDGDAPDFSSMMDHFWFADAMSTITEEVARDPYAIGYNIVSYLDLEYDDYIAAVAVDGAVPNTENFRNGSYPFITTACVAIRADEEEDSITRKLFDWIGSEKSIELIEYNSSLSVAVGESEILKYDGTEILEIPLSERLAELPDSIRKIFESEGKFTYVETDYQFTSLSSGERYTIDSFQPYISESEEHPEEYNAVLESFTIIDLDRDGKNEIVCLITSVMHGLSDYLILSDVGGKAYGYVMVYRGFVPLMADGCAWGSSGATSGQLYRFTAFTVDGYETETLAVEDYPYYEIAGKPVSEELFYAFCKEILVDSVLWAPCEKTCYSPDHTAWVKYSIDGTITLYYEDQVLDITEKFKRGRCYLYTTGSDGNGVYLSIQYKGEVAIGSDEFKRGGFSWDGYTTDDLEYTSADQRDPFYKYSLQGTFRLDDNDRIRIWQGDLVLDPEADVFLLHYYEAEDEEAYELAEGIYIQLYYPLYPTMGAFATRDGFMHLLQETKVDCFYHLNEDGLIDDIRGIYYP